MGKTALALIFLCFLAGCVSGPQATYTRDDPAEVVRQEVLTVMEIAGRGDWEALTPHLLYRGADKSRNTREPFRYDNPEDREAILELGRRIQALWAGGPVRFVAFKIDTQTEGDWHIWQVTYNDRGTERTANFAFLQIGGHYLLADIV